MLSFNSWNSHAVCMKNNDENFIDVPLTQTGVHSAVKQVSVVVRPSETCKTGFKVIVITDPEIANMFRATLELGHVEEVMTLPSRVVQTHNGRMEVSPSFSRHVELWYKGPFDPIETSVFVVGACQCVRVTCFESLCEVIDDGENESDDCMQIPATLDETTSALTKALNKKKGKRGRQ